LVDRVRGGGGLAATTPALSERDADIPSMTTDERPFSEVAFREELAYAGRWRAPISIVAETGSTNDDAKAAAATGAPDGSVFFADVQRAGRGQRGRVWEAKPGSGLLFSCIFRPNVAAAALPPLSLVMGLTVAEAVASWLDNPLDGVRGEPGTVVGIKWPNDVVVGRKKLAGVLVEAQIAGTVVQSVVVGVGLNVTPAAISEEVRERAMALTELGVRHPRERLLAELLRALWSAVGHYERSSLSWFLPRLRERDQARGRPLLVDGVPAWAAGIDDQGRLLVAASETPGAPATPLTSGDVVFAP
jgi:BirA family transcriptional regulator, biotin operon repressor / biotin---[acetyl-CoA-carboxylase] ligase